MSENGSQAYLESKNLSDVYQGYPIAEPVLSKTLTSKSRRKEKKETNWRVGILFIIFLSCLFIFVMICIGAVYIQKLQDNMQRLEQRVRVLENSVKDRLCKYEPGSVNIEETAVRARRSDPDEESSPPEDGHIHLEHHGIPSHHVAYVFGDPSKIDEHNFISNGSMAAFRQCGNKNYRRKDGQIWCPATKRKPYDRYLTSNYNHLYSYFAEAKWMNRPNAKYNFALHKNGTITVKHTGMYIVHASLHFSDLNRGDNPHYGVYKTDQNGLNTILISRCVVTITKQLLNDIVGVYPCQTWQLVGLEKGDLVYLRIGGYTWFRIEKETFHLALIRLNQEDIQ